MNEDVAERIAKALERIADSLEASYKNQDGEWRTVGIADVLVGEISLSIDHK
jgi:hypothetical protein